jgi:glycosyltransferase involved in cell wall biosynthesis
MNETLPLFSVIVPVLNGERFLEHALRSVYSQQGVRVEVLVFDGGSTDGTADILARFPEATVIVAPDGGPHDAMNRGIAMARGEFVAFLNSDDWYLDGVFAQAAGFFARDPSLGIVCGGSVVIDDRPIGDARVLAARDCLEGGGLGLSELVFGAPSFNARFFRRSVFDSIGVFDLHFHYAADRDLLLRARYAGVLAITLPRTIYVFRSHAASRTIDPLQINALSISGEHLAIIDVFLDRPGFPREAIRMLKNWRAFEYLRQASWCLKNGERTGFLGAIGRGWATDLLWPLSALRGLLLARRLWCAASRHGSLALGEFLGSTASQARPSSG